MATPAPGTMPWDMAPGGGQGFADARVAYVDARGTAISWMELGEIIGRERGYGETSRQDGGQELDAHVSTRPSCRCRRR